eukprot:6194806-Pleurochrysis_carterae.AAC.1
MSQMPRLSFGEKGWGRQASAGPTKVLLSPAARRRGRPDGCEAEKRKGCKSSALSLGKKLDRNMSGYHGQSLSDVWGGVGMKGALLERIGSGGLGIRWDCGADGRQLHMSEREQGRRE